VNDRWYFAYGSNLSRGQMEQRTGHIREERRARLDGYRLAFNKRGSDGTGKANIVPDAGAAVWGVVYRCSPDALREMDKHEGVAGGHYVRHLIRVRLDGGDELDAVTYVAGQTFLDAPLTPSAKYLGTILQGARQHRLPNDYIRSIEALANPEST
jgi:gamma-glutamylcyclotransferase